MEQISKASLPEFLGRRPFSVVHFDANWDGYRQAFTEKIRSVELGFEQSISLGYVDCDSEQEYARGIGIVNIPSVAYYTGTKLAGVVVGMQQDIGSNIERLIRGEPLNNTNVRSKG